MEIMLAPIALFVYSRPWHTRQTVEALLTNAEASDTQLYIFSDAPRDAAASQAVAEVRSYIRSIAGFKSVTIIERESNFGLARSIIDGVTRLCNEFGRVIVIEDDLIASPFFLKFINDGLTLYEKDERVISVAGYTYPIKRIHAKETFFLWGTDCWGWGTWKRGWDLFEKDGAKLLAELRQRQLCYQFDAQGAYGYTDMLRRQVNGRNDSWAIRWYASACLKNKLTLLPAHSLIKNIGLDGSGVHCSQFDNDPYSVDLWMHPIEVRPIPVQLDQDVENSLSRYFRSIKRRRIWNFLKMKLKWF